MFVQYIVCNRIFWELACEYKNITGGTSHYLFYYTIMLTQNKSCLNIHKLFKNKNHES